jgi:hypothetical protein
VNKIFVKLKLMLKKFQTKFFFLITWVLFLAVRPIYLARSDKWAKQLARLPKTSMPDT